MINCSVRHYAPSLGRWTAKDPVKFDGGINFYQYSYSDPVNYIDQNGKSPQFIAIGIVAAVVGTGSAIGTIIGNISNGADFFSKKAFRGSGSAFLTGALAGAFGAAGAIFLGPAAGANTLLGVFSAQASMGSSIAGIFGGLIADIGFNALIGFGDALGAEERTKADNNSNTKTCSP